MRAALVLILAACSSSAAPLPAAPGVDGLRAHLDAARAAPARAVDGWRIPEATWRGLVTDAYVDRWDDYRARFDAARSTLIAAVAAAPATTPRIQYVDDPTLDGAQVRMRWIVPVGRPGTIADGIPAVLIHDGAAWRALVSFDEAITATLPAACAAAYLDGSTKRCSEWSWEIGEAALRRLPTERACGNAIALGCGVTPGR